MGIKNYTGSVNTKVTPQTQPIPGTNQQKNSAGGYSFVVDDKTRLDRFLILGTEGGSYYSSARKLTDENAKTVIDMIGRDGLYVVNRVVEISDSGRAPKNDPAIFVLALCMKLGDDKTRAAAQAAISKVCRIGTHVFHLAEAVNSLGGWGRGTKRAFRNWYMDKPHQATAMQLIKYQQRDGWSHRDILRLIHPEPKNDVQAALFRYTIAGMDGMGQRTITRKVKGEDKVFEYPAINPSLLPRVIEGFEKAKQAKSDTEIVKLIEEYGLPRECIPTMFLNSPDVWRALLMSGRGMPFTAMLRNLAKMSAISLLRPMTSEVKYVCSQLRDADVIKQARAHPLNILIALRTYASGRGIKGSLTWSPDQQILDALDDCFYMSFGNVQKTGMNHLLGLDISGSMDSPAGGTVLSCREVTAAMAMVTARTEDNYHIMGFGTTFCDLKITAKDSLDSAMRKVRGPFQGTDCSLPMRYALERKIEVDTFSVYTDCETWAGPIHPSQALKNYRNQMGRPAKLVVVGMTPTPFTIADPYDSGMMDVAGFDTAVPHLIADFSSGGKRDNATTEDEVSDEV